MSFDSIIFLSCFLPALLIAYWLIPGLKAKNILLLIFSLIFYSFSGISGLILLIGFALFNYLIGRILGKKSSKAALAIGVAVNVAFLCFFKYLNFVLGQVLGLPEVTVTVAVPLGISFFTFKSISYLADTYRDSENAARSFG